MFVLHRCRRYFFMSAFCACIVYIVLCLKRVCMYIYCIRIKKALILFNIFFIDILQSIISKQTKQHRTGKETRKAHIFIMVVASYIQINVNIHPVFLKLSMWHAMSSTSIYPTLITVSEHEQRVYVSIYAYFGNMKILLFLFFLNIFLWNEGKNKRKKICKYFPKKIYSRIWNSSKLL